MCIAMCMARNWILWSHDIPLVDPSCYSCTPPQLQILDNIYVHMQPSAMQKWTSNIAGRESKF